MGITESKETCSPTDIIIDKAFLHEKFLKLIKGSELTKKGTLIINILSGDAYSDHREGINECGTKACMLYDIQDPNRDFLKDLKDRLKNEKDLEYNIVEATERNIWIQDQQDFYAAVVQHVINAPESLVMDVYISQNYSYDDEQEDKLYDKFVEETFDEGYLLAEDSTSFLAEDKKILTGSSS